MLGLCIGITLIALGVMAYLVKSKVDRFNEDALTEIKGRKSEMLYEEYRPGFPAEYEFEDLVQGKIPKEVMEKEYMISFYRTFASDSSYKTWFDVGISAVLVSPENEVISYPDEFLWVNDLDLGDCYIPIEEETAREIRNYLQNFVAKDSTYKKQQYIITTDFEFLAVGSELARTRKYQYKNMAFPSKLVLINDDTKEEKTFDIRYDKTPIPGKTEPFAVDSRTKVSVREIVEQLKKEYETVDDELILEMMKENETLLKKQVAGMVISSTCYCLVSGNERIKELKQEAKDTLLSFLKEHKITDPMPAGDQELVLNKLNCWNPGFFTSTYIDKAEMYFDDEGKLPYYVVCFVTHPFRHAVKDLGRTFLGIGAIWLTVIVVLFLLITYIRRKQEGYEKSRVAMTRAVAHELKTPLAVTKSYVDNWADIDDKTREKYSAEMTEQIDYVNKLVGDLLELSRMEAKAKKLNREEVNLAELNDVVLRQLSSLLKGKEVNVTTSPSPEDLVVNADLGMIRTVIANLVNNAIRHGDKKIDIDISGKKYAVRYQIKNDGTPIPADKIDLVWDAFYTADEARTKGGDTAGAASGGGTGLGLAITKQILVLHGAKYGCSSDETGTTFHFTL